MIFLISALVALLLFAITTYTGMSRTAAVARDEKGVIGGRNGDGSGSSDDDDVDVAESEVIASRTRQRTNRFIRSTATAEHVPDSPLALRPGGTRQGLGDSITGVSVSGAARFGEIDTVRDPINSSDSGAASSRLQVSASARRKFLKFP